MNRPTVLVVDDVPDNVKRLGDALEDEGYDVLAAYRGDEAVALARSERPDLILMGVMLPGMDGIEACRRLKADPELAPIPLIMLAARVDGGTTVNGLDAGAEDTITEPRELPIVVARVRSALRLKRSVDAQRRLKAEMATQTRLLGSYNRKIEEQSEQLHEASIRDPLTRLYNRRHFVEQANGLLALAKRNGKPLTGLMIDVDHFKRINDCHGHAAGDQVLEAFAGGLEGGLRRSDLVGRYGGEEFALILPETDGPGAEILADRIRQRALAVRVMDGRRRVRVSVSIGVVVYDPERHDDVADLLREASEVFRAVKRDGRDRVVVA
jgi:diguanylate cyclase (GGDEF)-like protein